jgi:hypothetical protein
MADCSPCLTVLPRVVALALVLALGGCIMALVPEQSESRIIITSSSPGSIEGAWDAMSEFSAKYDYKASPIFEGTGYRARTGLFGISLGPHAREQPLYISVFRRRTDGGIILSYQGQSDVRTNNNSVVNDLKAILVRHTRGAHIAYSYTPAHLQLTGMGD